MFWTYILKMGKLLELVNIEHRKTAYNERFLASPAETLIGQICGQQFV